MAMLPGAEDAGAEDAPPDGGAAARAEPRRERPRFMSQKTQILQHKFNHDGLRAYPIFNHCAEEFLKQLFDEFHVELHNPGDCIIKHGDIGENIYFLYRGRAELLASAHSSRPLATFTSGDFFGALEPLAQNSPAASVQALEFCDCRVVHHRAFNQVMQRFPQEKRFFENQIQERLGQQVPLRKNPEEAGTAWCHRIRRRSTTCHFTAEQATVPTPLHNLGLGDLRRRSTGAMMAVRLQGLQQHLAASPAPESAAPEPRLSSNGESQCATSDAADSPPVSPRPSQGSLAQCLPQLVIACEDSERGVARSRERSREKSREGHREIIELLPTRSPGGALLLPLRRSGRTITGATAASSRASSVSTPRYSARCLPDLDPGRPHAGPPIPSPIARLEDVPRYDSETSEGPRQNAPGAPGRAASRTSSRRFTARVVPDQGAEAHLSPRSSLLRNGRLAKIFGRYSY